MKHEVVIFRVERNVAGGSFPFDKTYFFKKETAHLLPRIFPHAFVIFPNKPFVGLIEDSIQRATCHLGKVYPTSRADEDKLKKMMASQNPIQDVIFNYKKYVGVIPVLYLQGTRKNKRVRPAYLHASSKVRPVGRYYGKKKRAHEMALDNMRRMLKDVVTGRSYFLSDGEEFRPVCSICSNSLAMITGQCHLGDKECFDNLAQTKPSDYRKNILCYNKWIKRLNEPEITLEAANE